MVVEVDSGNTNYSNHDKNLRIPATVHIGVTGHRKLAFEQVCHHVVYNCDVLITIWNAKAAELETP
jgi:hypothetical protein